MNPNTVWRLPDDPEEAFRLTLDLEMIALTGTAIREMWPRDRIQRQLLMLLARFFPE